MHIHKILIILLLLIVGGVVAFTRSSGSHPEVGTSAITAPQLTYSMLNMKLSSGSRDFNIKAVMEFPSQLACEQSRNGYSSLVQDFKSTCESAQGCKSLNDTACSSYVEDKYLAMLHQEKRDVYYIHVQGSQQDRGVIVFWGLNEEEAQRFCEKGQQDLMESNRFKSNSDSKLTASCITPH